MAVFRLGSGGEKIYDIDIKGGTIDNVPIGKGIARSASFSTVSTGAMTTGAIAGTTVTATGKVDAGSLVVSGTTSLGAVAGATLNPGTVLAGVTFRDVTATGAISAQAGVLVLSLGSNVVYVPIYTGLA